jgi:orotidine-5'-phosphate decarboxylase
MTPEHIIVPLDVPSLDQALALLEQLPEVSFWKVGLELFVSAGPQILEILKEREKRIFLDLKFHDIPNTVLGACRAASQYGVDLLTVHGAAGRSVLKLAAEAMNQSDGQTRILAITLLTHLISRDLSHELKIPLELPDYVTHMALLAKEAGVHGAVCSPLEVEQLRRLCGAEFLLVCPGVRPSWSSSGDQRRVMTPKTAIAAGADYLVIGRPITQASNLRQAWELVCEEALGAEKT